MPYFTDLHTYLHQSSLLIQAYPSTRITTKYSLPRKTNPKAKSRSKQPNPAPTDGTGTTAQTKREPSATLDLKTFHPESGICLKYKTDKAAEVGRLLVGLGRLAKGEVIEMSTPAAAAQAAQNDADKMEIDSGNLVVQEPEAKVVATAPAATQTAGGGGGAAKGKKKKGKK
jgi:hypothetical protein